jgi:very-short-patch-repair endonuclease
MGGSRDPERQRETRPPASREFHINGAPRRECESDGSSLGEFHLDRRLVMQAERQLGNLSREQLRAAGLTQTAIDHWVRRGRLSLRHRGVYTLAGRALPAYSAEMGAVLAFGSATLLSHASAAYVWGILPEPPCAEVTIIGRHTRSRPGIRVHRVDIFNKRDIRHRHGIPITSPPRTFLDIGPALDDRELERALHEALALKLLTMSRLRAALHDYPRRRGSARLAELARGSTTTTTRSDGEERLLRLIRCSRLPQPETNARVGHWSLDFYWPKHRLVVELDGIDFHSSRLSIERDHRKDLELRRLGIDVVRFVGRQVKHEPEAVLVTIARELALREPA